MAAGPYSVRLNGHSTLSSGLTLAQAEAIAMATRGNLDDRKGETVEIVARGKAVRRWVSAGGGRWYLSPASSPRRNPGAARTAALDVGVAAMPSVLAGGAILLTVGGVLVAAWLVWRRLQELGGVLPGIGTAAKSGVAPWLGPTNVDQPGGVGPLPDPNDPSTWPADWSNLAVNALQR